VDADNFLHEEEADEESDSETDDWCTSIIAANVNTG
jgi:hypothetical protein